MNQTCPPARTLKWVPSSDGYYAGTLTLHVERQPLRTYKVIDDTMDQFSDRCLLLEATAAMGGHTLVVRCDSNGVQRFCSCRTYRMNNSCVHADAIAKLVQIGRV